MPSPMKLKQYSVMDSKARLKVSQKLIQEGLLPITSNQQLEVIDILSQRSQKISLQQIINNGFDVDIDENGSTVYVIRPGEFTAQHSQK